MLFAPPIRIWYYHLLYYWSYCNVAFQALYCEYFRWSWKVSTLSRLVSILRNYTTIKFVFSDVTLKVVNYSPKEKINMLFINCKTRDNKNIVCCGPISLHNDEIKVDNGDILEFKNVQPHIEEKSSGSKFCLKMNGTSVVSKINLEDNNSKKQIIPYIPPILPDPTPRYQLPSRKSSVASLYTQEKETKCMLLLFIYLI